MTGRPQDGQEGVKWYCCCCWGALNFFHLLPSIQRPKGSLHGGWNCVGSWFQVREVLRDVSSSNIRYAVWEDFPVEWCGGEVAVFPACMPLWPEYAVRVISVVLHRSRGLLFFRYQSLQWQKGLELWGVRSSITLLEPYSRLTVFSRVLCKGHKTRQINLPFLWVLASGAIHQCPITAPLRCLWMTRETLASRL